MSFKFTKLEKKTFSKESSDFDELDLDNENVDDEKINQINNYQINNNLSSQLASMNNIKISEEEKIKEKEPQKNQEEKINNTQFYELTTNNLVEKIKNEYDEIYLNQQNDINKFVEKLANENSELKLEISKLKSEIMKLKIKNEFNYNINYNLNKVEKNKEHEINLEQYEEEKKKINDEYNYIIQNISSNLITKNIESLYDKLIKSQNDLYNIRKINVKLQEENEKLNLENNKIKFEFIQEKNKIIEKIIEIQSKANTDIELNKNIFLNQNEENKLNNVYLYYIDKIKNLTYEKNKLLTCNYDFFIKINDLSQLIEEKNNIINEKQKIISANELKILNLEQEINIIKIKNKEISNQLKEAQIKINEFSFDKGDNIVFQEKILDNKYNMMKRQLENKIAQLNKNLEDLNIKNINISKNNKELKETNEKLVTDFLLKKEQFDNIIKEKNQLIKDINNLKTDIKIKEEEIITNKNEYEIKIKYLLENINKENDNKKYDIEQIKSLINSIYEKLSSTNNDNNINSNIALFLKNNINEIAKLKEINKQMYSLCQNKEMNIILKEENEKLKNHIKEIMNLTLEKANITYIEKFKEEFINISLEQLILKIINFIKVYKICFLLQKIKTILNYSEKYINWLNEKEFFKNNNTSFDDVQLELKKIEEEINNIKIILKNNSLDFEKKIKNYLSKDEIKVEINNIQKKYEKIITDIIEYFLKHKNNNYKEDKEILSLQIPIKNYNLMIENNMNNLSLINQSIDSWSFFVNNDLNENNDNVFQAIINMTNLNNNIELNNINDFVVNNNNTENNMNENKYINSYEKEENENDENESNERNDTENKEKENESQYSIENKE